MENLTEFLNNISYNGIFWIVSILIFIGFFFAWRELAAWFYRIKTIIKLLRDSRKEQKKTNEYLSQILTELKKQNNNG